LSILRFTKKAIARDIEKVLRSAIANAVFVADKNLKRRLDEDDLVISACYANQGPSQKRVRPAPMGRAYQVIKRSTHLTVEVAEREK
jgi:large subunit ribosomal protein L22